MRNFKGTPEHLLLLLIITILLCGIQARAQEDNNILRTSESITKKWCVKVYRDTHNLVGTPESAVGGYIYHYKDVLECVQFGEWQGMIKYHGWDSEEEYTYSPKDWYSIAIGRREQIKNRQEFLDLLEKGKDAGLFEDEEGILFFIGLKYEGLDLLRQYAKHQGFDMISRYGVDPNLLRQLYREGKLSKEQLTAICMRMNYLVKKLLSSKQENLAPQDLWPTIHDGMFNLEEMTRAYGKDWQKDACLPDPDFGFIYKDDAEICHHPNEPTVTQEVHDGVQDPYVNYDPQALLDAEKKIKESELKMKEAEKAPPPVTTQMPTVPAPIEKHYAAPPITNFAQSDLLPILGGAVAAVVIVFIIALAIRRKRGN